MPTVLIKSGYRFFFYSNEHDPMHIHVEKENKIAKFNLAPVEMARSSRFSSTEIKEIRTLVNQNKELFKRKWNEYFINK